MAASRSHGVGHRTRDVSNRWSRIEELFHQATELTPAERSAFLQSACEGDNDLRGEVESLLAADKPETELLQTVVLRAVDELGAKVEKLPDTDKDPERITVLSDKPGSN